MILSVSRRTDIPARYMPWFMHRLRAGEVLVRNPVNYRQVSRITLSPDAVDCVVFWSKQPSPLLPHLKEIGQTWPYYLQYTLNGYGRDMEPGLPAIDRRMDTFRQFADTASPGQVIWRYDPVLLTDQYTPAWHVETFARIAGTLKGYGRECVFSFIDLYEKVVRNVRGLGVRGCTLEEADGLAGAFAAIARENGFRLRTCAEAIDLEHHGIDHGCCIDGALIQTLVGGKLLAKKDPGQRPACGCLESVDIGQYHTCPLGCRYCYANISPGSAAALSARHDPSSPLLVGHPEPEDRVKTRRMKSLKAPDFWADGDGLAGNRTGRNLCVFEKKNEDISSSFQSVEKVALPLFRGGLYECFPPKNCIFLRKTPRPAGRAGGYDFSPADG